MSNAPSYPYVSKQNLAIGGKMRFPTPAPAVAMPLAIARCLEKYGAKAATLGDQANDDPSPEHIDENKVQGIICLCSHVALDCIAPQSGRKSATHRLRLHM